jgi:hypothetical protein
VMRAELDAIICSGARRGETNSRTRCWRTRPAGRTDRTRRSIARARAPLFLDARSRDRRGLRMVVRARDVRRQARVANREPELEKVASASR